MIIINKMKKNDMATSDEKEKQPETSHKKRGKEERRNQKQKERRKGKEEKKKGMSRKGRKRREKRMDNGMVMGVFALKRGKRK
jgi:uncharacterized protein YdaU (DUF1376 family)